MDLEYREIASLLDCMAIYIPAVINKFQKQFTTSEEA